MFEPSGGTKDNFKKKLKYKMTKKQIIELILNTAGFELKEYEIIRAGSLTGYEGTAYDGKGGFIDFATDSFEDAIREILEDIYNTKNVEFNTILK
jgi:hypothetical protein|uniref:Uncharacterized protein n=1 Tax=Myoviridae sp. ctQV19 TaxID=2827607 RepID=A0A8S5RSR7_9CAUD|nr:MAG TPA: hypothetical protein [Myoviridae sp. ctQV19]